MTIDNNEEDVPPYATYNIHNYDKTKYITLKKKLYTHCTLYTNFRV